MADKFYSSIEWHKLRSKVRKAWQSAGLPCGYCGQPFDVAETMVVDHIKNRKQHQHLALDPGNLHCVHHRCNTKKAAYIENNNREQIGIDGFPEAWGGVESGGGK